MEGRKVTYGRIVAEIRPQEAETHRTRLTVEGNSINFPGDVTTTTADLITDKLIFNSVLSTKTKIHVHRKLLSNKYHGKKLVYEATTGNYSRIYHPTKQPQKLSAQILCIYGNTKGDAWDTPSRKNCKR